MNNTNNINPFLALLRSRKFWLATLDSIISIIIYYVNMDKPERMEDVMNIIKILKIPTVILITTITIEDVSRNHSLNERTKNVK